MKNCDKVLSTFIEIKENTSEEKQFLSFFLKWFWQTFRYLSSRLSPEDKRPIIERQAEEGRLLPVCGQEQEPVWFTGAELEHEFETRFLRTRHLDVARWRLRPRNQAGSLSGRHRQFFF